MSRNDTTTSLEDLYAEASDLHPLYDGESPAAAALRSDPGALVRWAEGALNSHDGASHAQVLILLVFLAAGDEAVAFLRRAIHMIERELSGEVPPDANGEDASARVERLEGEFERLSALLAHEEAQGLLRDVLLRWYLRKRVAQKPTKL